VQGATYLSWVSSFPRSNGTPLPVVATEDSNCMRMATVGERVIIVRVRVGY